MPNIFKDGGGAGIGSFIVVFKNGELAPDTDVLKLRGAYEAGEQIFISIIDEETEDALIPASGWVDEEAKLHLVARDFDDDKTYNLTITDAPIASEIVVEADVEDGINIGGEQIPSADSVEAIADAAAADAADAVRPYLDETALVIPEQAEEAPSYVGSIKQGEASIPLKDGRLPEAAAADQGKVVKVNASGEYELGADAAGVTEERVQQMIDAAIGQALAASY